MPALDPAISLFIADHQSIHVAAVDRQGTPTLVRGLGCRVADGRVRLLVNVQQAGALLDAVRETGRVAATFSQPDSHKTLQLKGRDCRVMAAVPADVQLHQVYIKRFTQRLLHFGIAPLYTQTLCACQADDLGIVEFAPEATFQQSPGANAGDLLTPGGLNS